MDEYEVEMTCVRRYTFRVKAPTREEAMMIANHKDTQPVAWSEEDWRMGSVFNVTTDETEYFDLDVDGDECG